MLPFPTDLPPSVAEPAPRPAPSPGSLGATPDGVISCPPPQKRFPWLLAGAASVAIVGGTALTWWMLRKKPGEEPRLENPVAAESKPKKPTEPIFTLDDEPETFTLTEFLDNNEHLSSDDLEAIEVMKVGDEHALGGGAWARFVLKRVG